MYLLNPLSGAFSRFDSIQLQREWSHLKNGKAASNELVEHLKSKSFLFEKKEEEDDLTLKLRMLDNKVTNMTLRCNIILTYDCNLNCSYCFEKGIDRKHKVMSIKNAENCLNILKDLSVDYEKVEIVLFGGEPLLYNSAQQKCIEYILNYSNNESWEVDIVTNGVDLKKYVPLLKRYENISQIQVTIDGPKELHDLRRPKEDGTGSFEDIEKSIDMALANNLKIACRINVDKENVNSLPDIIQFFEQKNWYDYKFISYSGVTFDFLGDYEYEEHPHIILKKMLKMRLENEKMKKLSFEAWEPLQFILYPYFTGKTKIPKFKFCSAQRSEISMDLNGKVYFCVDSVGRSEYEMGYYNNTITLNFESANKLREYDVTQTKDICDNCNLQLCCGGGCWFKKDITNSKGCTQKLKPLLQTAIEFLHYHPEVFNAYK